MALMPDIPHPTVQRKESGSPPYRVRSFPRGSSKRYVLTLASQAGQIEKGFPFYQGPTAFLEPL